MKYEYTISFYTKDTSEGFRPADVQLKLAHKINSIENLEKVRDLISKAVEKEVVIISFSFLRKIPFRERLNG